MLEAEIAVKDARIAELEKRINLNSQNSHMPSSKDSVSIKAKKSSRRVKGGKIGGQKDHDGHTLMQFDLVDDSKECVENKCSCGCSLK